MESDASLSPEVPINPPPGYPDGFDETVELDSGVRIHVRPIVPDDIDRVRHAFEVGDSESIRSRFFTGAPPAAEHHLHYLVEVDYRERFALVAMDSEGNSIGIARYEGAEDMQIAEVAVVVEPGWRRRGIAELLLERLERRAFEVGISSFEAFHLPDNTAISELLDGLGYSGRMMTEGLVHLEKRIS